MNAPLPRGRYLRANAEIFERLDAEASKRTAQLRVRVTWADVARAMLEGGLKDAEERASWWPPPPKPSKKAAKK